MPNYDASSLIALCYTNKRLGVACFEELIDTISVSIVNVSANDMDETLTNLKCRFKPTLFLISPKIVANKPLLDLVLSNEGDGSPDYYRFQALKSSDWNEKKSLELIRKSLSLKGDRHNQHRINSLVDLDNSLIVSPLGALLSYMQSSLFHLDDGKVQIATVETFSLPKYMYIDTSTFIAMQIFAEDVHPNVIRGQGKAKEGFSLLGLFDRTHSVPGRNKLREWMAKPFCDIEKITERQKGVAFAVRAASRDLIKGEM